MLHISINLKAECEPNHLRSYLRLITDLNEAIASFVPDEVNNDLVHSAPVGSHLIALLNGPIGKYQTRSV